MKSLLVICGLILTGCSLSFGIDSKDIKKEVVKEEIKPDRTVTAQQIQLARCICAKYELKLDQILRNEERNDFTCMNPKTKKRTHLFVWDKTFVEGCI